MLVNKVYAITQLRNRQDYIIHTRITVTTHCKMN